MHCCNLDIFSLTDKGDTLNVWCWHNLNFYCTFKLAGAVLNMLACTRHAQSVLIRAIVFQCWNSIAWGCLYLPRWTMAFLYAVYCACGLVLSTQSAVAVHSLFNKERVRDCLSQVHKCEFTGVEVRWVRGWIFLCPPIKMINIWADALTAAFLGSGVSMWQC